MNLQKLAQSGKFQEIVEIFRRKKAVKYKSTDLVVFAAAFANTGKLGKAVQILNTHYEKNKNDVIVGEALAQFFELGKQFSEALEVYESLRAFSGADYLEAKIRILENTNDAFIIQQIIIENFSQNPKYFSDVILKKKLFQLCSFALSELGKNKNTANSLIKAKIYLGSGEFSKAEIELEQICAKEPLNETAMCAYIQAVSNHSLKKLDEGLFKILRTANVEIEELGPDTLNDYAVSKSRYGDTDAAVQILEVATSKSNYKTNISLNLSELYQELGQFKKSEQLLVKLNQRDPEDHVVIEKLGKLYSRLKLHLRSFDYFQKLYTLSAGKKGTFGLAKCLQDLARQNKAENLLKPHATKDPEYARMFLYNSHYIPSIDSTTLLDRYKKYGKIIASQLRQSKTTAIFKSNDNMRVGILSGDFYNHPTTKFLKGFLALENYPDVEVYLISATVRKDQVTENFKKRFGSRWIDISLLDTEQAVKQVRDVNLDWVIDVNGHTGNNRLDILARRIANKQVATLGMMCTTGLPFIDYLLLPEDIAKHDLSNSSVEKFITTKSAIPFESDIEIATLSSNFGNDELSMITCSRLIRHSERLWRTWARIQEKTNAKLIINCADTRSNKDNWYLLERLQKSGLKRELIELKFTTPIYRAYDEADLTLDTFPANSGTTLCESIICGKPFVSLSSVAFIGSLGSAILKEIKHERLVAETEEEYIDTAVAILQDVEFRKKFFSDRVKFKKILSDHLSFTSEVYTHLQNERAAPL